MRRELIYYNYIHESDMLCHPALYKFKRTKLEEKLVSLCSFSWWWHLSNAVFFLTNSISEVAITIFSSPNNLNGDAAGDTKFKKHYLALVTEGSYNAWNISEQSNIGIFGNLEPTKAWLCWYVLGIFVDFNIEGDCDVSNERTMIFFLRNYFIFMFSISSKI